MRAVLVRFAGLALYVHELRSGTLALLHERPNRKATLYELKVEDFEDCADELDDDAATVSEPALELSAVGLSLCLFKNDGVLKITLEGGHGGVVDWTFQGLRSLNEGSMMACAFTQTIPEAPLCCGGLRLVPPKLSISTIQASDTYPTPERVVQPPFSGLSTMSTIETLPVESPAKHNLPSMELDVGPSAVEKGNELKRKVAQDVERLPPHKRSKSSHDSPSWPNHLYMTCNRTRPISKSDIGTLHIDLVEGTVWFEDWYGKENARTFERKQVDLHCYSSAFFQKRPCKRPYSRASTSLSVHYTGIDTAKTNTHLASVHYLSYDIGLGTDKSTHHLDITKRNMKNEMFHLFRADCSAPGWEMWGSDTDTSPGPNPTLTAKEQIEDRNAGVIHKIPHPLPNGATACITPTIIVNALVHCIDRASQRQAIHDPDTDHKILKHLEWYPRFRELRRLTRMELDRWDFKIKEVEEREARRRKLRTVNGEEKTDERTKLEYWAANGTTEDSE
jgi:hypothetical protein